VGDSRGIHQNFTFAPIFIPISTETPVWFIDFFLYFLILFDNFTAYLRDSGNNTDIAILFEFEQDAGVNPLDRAQSLHIYCS
jgi:hypothetical protein